MDDNSYRKKKEKKKRVDKWEMRNDKTSEESGIEMYINEWFQVKKKKRVKKDIRNLYIIDGKKNEGFFFVSFVSFFFFEKKK